MNVFLTANKAKQQARVLVDYLSSIHRGISYGNALEAVSRMYGAREWNVLAAALGQDDKPAPDTPLGLPDGKQQFLAIVDGKPAHMRVYANLVTDDGVDNTDVDLSQWLLTAPNSQVIRLVEDHWETNYLAVDALREFGDAGVARVLDCLKDWNQRHTFEREPLGWTLKVSELDALRFCRAFRYPLFVEMLLTRHFGTLDRAYQAGIEVFPDNGDAGCWVWRNQADGSDVSYATPDLAYRALGLELEDEFHAWVPSQDVLRVDKESGFLGVMPLEVSDHVEFAPMRVLGRCDKETGAVLVLDPRQKNLTKKQLRIITEEGKFPIQVAVSVDMSTLIEGDIEVLNDRTSELVTGSTGDLSDLSFERFSPAGEATLHDMRQNVFILVTAQWEPFDGMYDEGEEEEDAQG